MSLITRVGFFVIVLIILLTGSRYILAEDGEREVTPTPKAVEAIDSYDLFWPIVAGKVMGDRLYPLKMLKERLRQTFIFSDYRKADYNITLSVKRAVEAEKLFLVKKDYSNAKKTLDLAQEKREKAKEMIVAQEEKGMPVTDLVNALKASLEKQRSLLKYIASQVPAEQKGVVEENINKLDFLYNSLNK